MADGWVSAPVPAAASELIGAGFPAVQARLLAQRGVGTPAEAAAFLAPELGQLSDPRRLRGLSTALERLARAAEGGETVAIVGDYDVDGVAATALLTATLRAVGARPQPILARRHEEGYGFQPVHAHLARELGATVLVTVDCGTNSREAAAEARRHAEHAEVLRGDLGAEEALRLPRPGEVERGVAARRHALEHLVLLPPVEVVGRRHGELEVPGGRAVR